MKEPDRLKPAVQRQVPQTDLEEEEHAKKKRGRVEEGGENERRWRSRSGVERKGR